MMALKAAIRDSSANERDALYHLAYGRMYWKKIELDSSSPLSQSFMIAGAGFSILPAEVS